MKKELALQTHAWLLFQSGKYDYNREVLANLATLHTSEQREEYARHLSAEHHRKTITSLARFTAAERQQFINFILEHQIIDIDYRLRLMKVRNLHDWRSKLRNLTSPGEKARGVEKIKVRERIREGGHERIHKYIRITRVPGMVQKTKKKDVKEYLDRMPLHINRTVLRSWSVPELTNPGYPPEQTVPKLQEVVRGLNLTDAAKEGYLSEELLMDIIPLEHGERAESLVGRGNQVLFDTRILPRLSLFVKSLWGLPLSAGEVARWSMYDDQKPHLRQAVSYVFDQMIGADSGTRMTQFLQFAQGFLRCQTGQKETIDSLVQSLEGQRLVNAGAFNEKLSSFFALEKNIAFRAAMLPADSGGDVHVASVYYTKLREELGLSSSLGSFKERSGLQRRADRTRNDPFRHSGNALLAFYEHFNPAYLIDRLYSQMQTKADYALGEEIGELRGRISRERGPA